METNIDNTYTYSRLPRQLPIKKLGKQYLKLEGYVKISSLARVDELLVKHENQEDSAEIFITFDFRLTEKNNIIVEADVNQELALLCQRCGKEVHHIISSTIRIVLVKSLDKLEEQNIKNKLVNYEPVVINFSEMLDLYQIIEDEIILALPIVIKHDDDNAECFNYSNFTI